MNEHLTDKPLNGSVLCFGELLFRVSLDAGGAWLQKHEVPFYIGGAELNVATALALWDIPSAYLTALPDNGMSAQIAASLQAKRIDASRIFHHGRRVGLYYLTSGADIKNDSLIYDRAGSAFSELKPGMIDWDKVFSGVSWLHFSAICPAISMDLVDVCEEALQAASARNILISLDLNYRSRLWQYGKSPKEVMPRLARYCDLIMGNIWAAENMLGIPVPAKINSNCTKADYLDAAQQTSQQIITQYPKCRAVAKTFRFDAGEKGILYYTTLYTGGSLTVSAEYRAERIVNKVGSGDCFMAGLIHGFYHNRTAVEVLEFATLAAFDKLFIESDATGRTVAEIKTRKNESSAISDIR